jgi:hypothetical protein
MDPTTPDPATVTQLSEGDFDPGLKKRVRVLIQRRPDYIVYLDDDFCVQWKLPTRNVASVSPHAHDILNDVGLIETLSEPLQGTPHLGPARRLLGEAVARLLSGGTDCETAARRLLRDAQVYLQDRMAEMARIWFLSAAGVFAGLSLIVMLVLWLNRVFLTQVFNALIVDAAFGAGLGALGAFMSLLTRSSQIRVAAGAGRRIHYVEALSRVTAGAVGAVIVALAVKANLLLGLVNDARGDSTLLYFLCLVSGASERLVPGLIARVEAATVESPPPNDRGAPR